MVSMSTELSEKEQMRRIYLFNNDVAFDSFYEGLLAAHSNQTKRSIELFREAVQADPSNPIPYNFLAMSLEFDESVSEEERLKVVEKWAEVAGESGNTTQMLRSQMALKWYKMTPEERKEASRHGKNN